MKRCLTLTWLLAGAAAAIAQVRLWTNTVAVPAGPIRPVITGAAPRIVFDSMVFDFGKVESGQVVKHDFRFTNTGNAMLEIRDVRPGCGCTTAGTWDRTVQPGQSGTIPLQFNSVGYATAVAKSVTVTCNDPAQSNVFLQIKGLVWKPIDVTPPMVVFSVAFDAQSNQTRTVRILNNLEEPLTLSDLSGTNATLLGELKTVRPDKEFELQITALPPFPMASTNVPISLKTSSARTPVLMVSAYFMVQPPIMLAPSQIYLPAGPLASATHPAVTIRNNTTNTLVLSEPTINVPGVDVALQEAQPGRIYTMTVNFPAGFQLQPGQPVEVNVKSSLPRMPLLRVPVFQTQARPYASPVPPKAVPAAAAPVRTFPAPVSGK